MSNPAAYVVTGVVIAVAALIAYFVNKPKHQKPMSYDRKDRGTRTSKPPSSPLTSYSVDKSEKKHKCPNCGEIPYVKISPCNHESLCVCCVGEYLKNNDTCPTCNGRIDSCSPPIPYYGKCQNCRQFTELFEILPCKHPLSLCISCFEREKISYKKCPTCRQIIRGYKPESHTSGLCIVCDEFTFFAKFKPCGHGNMCEKHAKQYLIDSEYECSECGKKVVL